MNNEIKNSETTNVECKAEVCITCRDIYCCIKPEMSEEAKLWLKFRVQDKWRIF